MHTNTPTTYTCTYMRLSSHTHLAKWNLLSAQNIYKHAQETGISDGPISCASVADAIGSSSSLSPPSESSPNRSNSLGNGSACAESPTEYFDATMNDELVSHSVDEQHKLNKFLFTMDQRLVAGKTDMEDLIAQLNQEIAVKESLSSKVHLFLKTSCCLTSSIEIFSL